jgi:hypothetical protein
MVSSEAGRLVYQWQIDALERECDNLHGTIHEMRSSQKRMTSRNADLRTVLMDLKVKDQKRIMRDEIDAPEVRKAFKKQEFQSMRFS